MRERIGMSKKLSKYEDNRMNGLEIDGDKIETLFKVEPPLTKSHSDYGYIGVILVDREDDTIQCHICGRWLKALGTHLIKAHGTTAVQYKEEFSLPKRFPLICRGTSSKMSKSSSREDVKKQLSRVRDMKKLQKSNGARKNKPYFQTEAYLNSKGLCKKQILSRYYAVADIVGKNPSAPDLVKYDQALLAAIHRRYNNSINEFRRANGIPNIQDKIPKITEEVVVAAIRKFVIDNNGKIPIAQNFFKGTPNAITIRKIFGSFNRALSVAGVR